MTLEINIEPLKLLMQLVKDGENVGECKYLPLGYLRIGTSVITVSKEDNVYLDVEIRVEREETDNSIKEIKGVVNRLERDDRTYHQIKTEIFNGNILDHVSIEIF